MMDSVLQVGSYGPCIHAAESLCLESKNSQFGQVLAKMQVPSLGACESLQVQPLAQVTPDCGLTHGLTPCEQCCPDCEGCRHTTHLLNTCPEMSNALLEGSDCFLNACMAQFSPSQGRYHPVFTLPVPGWLRWCPASAGHAPCSHFL